MSPQEEAERLAALKREAWRRIPSANRPSPDPEKDAELSRQIIGSWEREGDPSLFFEFREDGTVRATFYWEVVSPGGAGPGVVLPLEGEWKIIGGSLWIVSAKRNDALTMMDFVEIRDQQTLVLRKFDHEQGRQYRKKL